MISNASPAPARAIERALPILIDATGVDGVPELDAFMRPHIQRHLHAEGGLLFRTTCLGSISAFEALVAALSPELMSYDYGSTPRQKLSGKIYSSTEYPPEHSIGLHNEMSYTTSWPERIWFYCNRVAEAGGETPVADSRTIYRRISASVRSRFEERGLLYIRNYRPGLDVSWQQTFNTSERNAVEDYCRNAGISFRWQGDELKTWQKCQAVARHPVTGETVWFNQAHLFHASSLPAKFRDALRAMFAEDELPRNVLYGDGTPIEDAALSEIRAVLEEEKRIFPWREGDVLMLDNMLVAHGREPFRGSRSVAVAMA
jgi:alpha-ketoglutarate-dependent taurine dioxygenase